MTTATRTVHLVDDRRMGGVTRFLEQLTELRLNDSMHQVKRGTMRAKPYEADTIVSHLAISWRSMPMLIALRACNPKARLIHVEHSYCGGFERHRVPVLKRFHTLLRAVYALFDDVIAVSEGQARWMRDTGIIPNRKVTVATPLVDLTPFLAIPNPQPESGIRYGFVGRLDEQKGLDQIISGWRKHAPENARFEIFGNGPYRDSLEDMAKGDARITFHGVTDTPAEAYRLFDIALMPSRWEPYGLSCLEAQAAGRPVLVADVDGLPEQVATGGGLVLSARPEDWYARFAQGFDAAFFAEHTAKGRIAAQRHGATSEARWIEILADDEADETIVDAELAG